MGRTRETRQTTTKIGATMKTETAFHETGFTRYCYLGTIKDDGKAYVQIRYRDGRLSITGQTRHSFGQIDDMLREAEFLKVSPEWEGGKIAELLDIWNEWHLNDMRAGTTKQREYIKARAQTKPHASYEDHCRWLRDAGLYVDNGYTYGTAWLREEVPVCVLRWLEALPNSADAEHVMSGD